MAVEDEIGRAKRYGTAQGCTEGKKSVAAVPDHHGVSFDKTVMVSLRVAEARKGGNTMTTNISKRKAMILAISLIVFDVAIGIAVSVIMLGSLK